MAQIPGDELDNVLPGTAEADTISGFGGNDLLEGGAGGDTLNGGAGFDTASYQGDAASGGTAPVIVNLSTTSQTVNGVTVAAGTARDGFGSIDTLSEIEAVRGTAGADVFYSGNGTGAPGTASNTFYGLAGNDTFYGSGGQGPDTVDYSLDVNFGATHGIKVNMSAQTVQGNILPDTVIDSFDGTDSIPGVRNVTGTQFRDEIYGGGNANVLIVGAGDDFVDAGGGNDTISGGAGADVIDAGDGDDTISGGAGADVINAGNGADTIIGGAGADTMDGGLGVDTLDYGAEDGTNGIYVNLLGRDPYIEVLIGPDGNEVGLDTAIDTFGDRDSIPNIPNVIGTVRDDVIYGGNRDNLLQGREGDDILLGGGRNDTLEGGAGTDTAIFRGNRADYTAVAGANGIMITDLRPDPLDPVTNLRNDGEDTVREVEFFQFADGTVSLADLLNPPAPNVPPVITSNGGGDTAGVTVAENTTAVTTVTASDPNPGDSRSYSISGGFDGNLFSIDSQTGVLAFLQAPDFENPTLSGGIPDQFYDVRVRATDGSGAFDEQLITVTVTNANEAPTQVLLSSLAIAEDADNGTLVGILTASDPDAGDSTSFTLLDDAAGRFAIAGGNQLVVANGVALDYEQSATHQITVRATDGSGAAFDQVLSIGVTNVDPDNVTGTAGDDIIHGGALDDVLVGNLGNDTLVGGSGNDELRGQWGVDALTGGAGVDRYWGSVTDWNGDRITDYEYGETIAVFAGSQSPDAYRLRFDGTDTYLDYDSSPSVPGFEGSIILSGRISGTIAVSPFIAFGDLYAGVTITSAPPPNPLPVITSNGGGDTAAVTIAENSTSVTTVVATDPDAGQSLTYSIVSAGNGGGADAAKFEIDSQTGVLTFVAAPDFETPADAGGNNVYDVTVQVSDSNGGSDTQAIAVTVTNVNEAPALDLNGAAAGRDVTMNYTEQQAATPIAPEAVVSDTDSADFSGGSLRVAQTLSAGTDRLTIGNIGTGAGQIGVSGNTVSYEGTAIGTFSGGTAGGDLVITFNGSSVTAEAVQALVRDIHYENGQGDIPAGIPRTYTYVLDDGNGGASTATATATVNVKSVNDPPAVTAGNTVTYTENHAATAISPAATVTDVDAIWFSGGSLTVSLTANGTPADQLTIGNIGTGVGQIGISGNTVSFQGIAFGTFSGGVNGADLTINFFTNTAPTPAAVQALLRDVQFSNTSDDPSTDARIVTFILNDGGNTGGPPNLTGSDTATINVATVNDAPVLDLDGTAAGTGAILAYTENQAATAVAPDATVSDVDSTNFNGGILNIGFAANGSTADQLSIGNQGSGAGQIGVSGNTVTFSGTPIGTFTGGANGGNLVISFTSDAATTTAIQALTRQILYANSSETPSLAPRSLLFTMTDGDGNANGGADVASAMATIHVTSVNHAPVLTSNGGADRAALGIPENAMAVTTVTASDPDPGETLTYSISGGFDRNLFSINSQTGALVFLQAPDFENPNLNGGIPDQFYDVRVRVTDGSGAFDEQLITVTVTNVAGATQTSNAAVITGTSEEETLTGLGAANTLLGLAGNDVLNGGGGGDTLDGGTGADAMAGGTGNDTYVVDNAGDTVTENIGAGTDTVRTAVAAYSLAALANVENLTFTGTGAFTGTGNGLANVITGGAGNDVLDGAAGNDRTVGGLGDDTYHVDSASDVVVEQAGAGSDLVLATASAFTLGANVENLTFIGVGNFSGTGNGLDNVLTGGGGNDTLDGRGGDDVVAGGAGADDLRGDGGADRLDGGIGTDELDGGAGDDVLIGGADADVLLGGGGADLLDGGLGADRAEGGAGADVYIVDNALDVVVENAGAGIDEVRTVLQTYALSANVENLSFVGSGPFTGTGNGLNNVLTGGASDDALAGGAGNDRLSGLGGNDTLSGEAGRDILDGGAGNDVLTGGAGGDTFVFNLPTDGLDTVTDFASGPDKLGFSAGGFGGGLVSGQNAVLVSAAVIGNATQPGSGGYFIFDNAGADAGTVYWDATGGNGADAVAVVRLVGVTALQASDLQIL